MVAPDHVCVTHVQNPQKTQAYVDQVHVVVLCNGSPCSDQRRVVGHPLACGAPGPPGSASARRVVNALHIIALILSPSDELDATVVVDALASVNGDDGPAITLYVTCVLQHLHHSSLSLPCIAEPVVPNHAGSGQEVVGTEGQSCFGIINRRILWARNGKWHDLD